MSGFVPKPIQNNQINQSNQSNQPNLLFYSTKCKTCNVFMSHAQNNGVLRYFKLICIDGNEQHFLSKGLKIIPTIIVKNLNKPVEGKDCLIWLENVLKMKSGNNFEQTNEQYLPEVGITNNQNQSNPLNQHNPNRNSNFNPNSNPNSNLNSNLNSNPNSNPNQGQFQVPNTNILKRNNELTAIAPPIPNTNIKGRQNQTDINQNQSLNQNRIVPGNNGSGGITSTGGNISSPSVKPVHQLFGYLENEMSGFSDSYAYLLVDNALPKSFLPPDKDMQIYTAPEGNKLDKKTQEMYLKNMELYRENEKKQIKDKYENEQNIIMQNNLRK